ncbi:MAG TPA: SCO6880 family protein [Acidimicrobiales bacterium]
MTSIGQSQVRRYRFGPRNHRGTLGGLRWGQVLLVFVAVAISVVILRSGRGDAGVVVALLVSLAGVALATWPLGGRTLQQWVPLAARFGAAGAFRTHRGVSYGEASPASSRSTRPFEDLVIVPLDTAYGQVGVVIDRARRSMSAMLSLSGSPYALLDDGARQQIADAWSGVLSAIAQQPGSLYRLSWIERTLPDHALALGVAAAEVFASSVNEALVDARRSYLSLLGRESAGSFRHESLLVVTVRGRLNARGELPRELSETLNAVATRCIEGGLGLAGVIAPDGVRTIMARSFVPSATLPRGNQVFPLATREEWSALCTDGTWHATYWVAEWPRADVGNDFLLPFLLESGYRRSIVVVMAPQAITHAVRDAERARTEKAADFDLRRRHGFAQTARALREQEAVTRRESELASGHGAFRFGGYVVVTAATRTELELDCARTEQAAARAYLALRRLYGAQREALLYGLPLGRGL